MSQLKPVRSPWRRLLRFGLWSGGTVALVAVICIGILVYWTSSEGFEVWARKRMAANIEKSIGGRVEIRTFHWRPLQLEAEVGGVIVHGLEGPDEAPFARVQLLRTRLSIRDFWSPRVLLRDLDVVEPEIHLISYPDGSTNQPRPAVTAAASGKSTIDSVFDLEAGHIAVRQGAIDLDDRSAQFDFQQRLTLLDFSASDVSLLMGYSAASRGNPERYRIEAGARDFQVARGVPRGKAGAIDGYMQGTFDLTRTALYVRSFRLTSRDRSTKGKVAEHAVDVSGSFEDFAHPRWQGRVTGDLDMRLLDPVLGYPDAPEGIARLNLSLAGAGGRFNIDGGVHAENAAYVGTGVNARNLTLDAHVHATPEQLLITSVGVQLKPGGRLEGTVALDHWLAPLPGAAVLEAARPDSVRAAGMPPPRPTRKDDVTIPVNGKVNATLKDVSLDTLLDMVGQAPLQRLGFDTRLTGPATATWNRGETSTLVVGATMSLAAPSQALPGEVPASGTIDATYAQRNGSVDLRTLALRTPGGELDAVGQMGAYPVTSPSNMNVEFHSSNLADFDVFLRDLGLVRGSQSGVAALPVHLGGEFAFHGAWTGSLVDPHLNGTAQASQLDIETAAPPGDKSGQPQWVHWDAIEAGGSYSAAKIGIDHGTLSRGDTRIALDGTLTAAQPATAAGHKVPTPAFDDDSVLRMHVHATKVGVDQLLPLTGRQLPMTGVFDTQLELDGPIRNLNGSGWAEMAGGSIYGQPLDHVRLQGTLASQLVKLSSVAVSAAGGAISANGQLNIDSKQFQLDSNGSGIALAGVATLNRNGVELAGALSFTLTGSGTLDDPRLEGHAKFAAFALNEVPLGSLTLTAQTANRSLVYEAETQTDVAGLTLHGQTAMSEGYATQARLEFKDFNAAALLKMAHLEGLGGESAMAGTVTLDGPLARPEELRGEARLNELAATVSGVHLKSDGGFHAALANSRIVVDPLHVVGEETDLRAQGSIGLKDQQQLDFAASGSINLKLGQMLDPDLTASGTTTFQVEGHGPLKNPGLRGRIEFQNGSLALEDVPNGLSQLHGTLEFNQDRLEVKSLTATSGGGQLSVGGYLAYQHGLYADLRVTGKGIRIRYPTGVSSLADGTFRLQGLQNNLLLSGNVLITRFSVSPDFDVAGLAAQSNAAQTLVSPDAPSNHIRLDVRVTSSPQLNFQNAMAKLAGDVDLRLRGTVASPTLLGSVQITEGSALIAGTRYELQRGTVSFTNPVRIEPSIDLSASAHVSDYDITLGLHGTPAKLSVSYRSDPPLPEADVVALLALGRTGDQQRLYTQQQEQQGSSATTDVLLGGALNATVSSRVQKLFGAGSVKVDPNYLGALGNSTSRIIVEEQLGRNVTLTYATNVDTTQQQLLQAEVAINRHVSLLVARDESGVFSMVVKATRRYR